MAGYKELQVWRDAMALVERVYAVTQGFPLAERYGLAAQMRSAAVSIPANIAEGYGRRTGKAYVSFLRIAKGSLNELETLLEISVRLGMLRDEDSEHESVTKLGSRLSNLITSVAGDSVREDDRDYVV